MIQAALFVHDFVIPFLVLIVKFVIAILLWKFAKKYIPHK